MAFVLKVHGFAEGASIPKPHTCDGENRAPAMEWSGAPRETRSYALIVDDPDAPGGTWNHLLLWDLSADLQALPEGVKPNSPGVNGNNDFGKRGYGGPCPPKGHGPHRYYFKLYAVDVPHLALAEGAKRADLDRALKGHVLAEAQYMGKYERK
jgi:Raf kinase inhibitor-like YbhB/YbcL family protein